MKHNSDAIVHLSQAKYLEGLELPRDGLLAKMEAFASERNHPISDPEVATFLAVTIRAQASKQIVEVGTNIGYGAIVMARAAREASDANVRVVTIENSHELCETARGFAREAGLADVIDVREGDAITELDKLEEKPWIDLAYVDCVKEGYPRYLELLLPRLRAGGVVVADNVLWRGLVAAKDDPNMPETEYARVEALRRFNHTLTTSPLFRAVILPLGDGVAYAVKK